MAKPDTPYTRREMYLDSIAGGNASIPDHPLTREEMYLDAIAKNGGGSTAGGGLSPLVKFIFDPDTETYVAECDVPFETLSEYYEDTIYAVDDMGCFATKAYVNDIGRVFAEFISFNTSSAEVTGLWCRGLLWDGTSVTVLYEGTIIGR